MTLKVFKILGGLGIAVTLAVVFVWLLYVADVKTLTLSDVNVTSCDELPNISELDALFSTNSAKISELLADLSTCQNNISVCKRYSKCQEENYSGRMVRSGNTIIEWKEVPACRAMHKGALHIAYSSGCELEKINTFQDKYQDFKCLPVDWFNY